MIVPPQPPVMIAVDDDDGARRLRQRLYLISCTMVTLVVTAWLVLLGPVPAILGLVTAKHILVAILVMGLGVDARKSNS